MAGCGIAAGPSTPPCHAVMDIENLEEEVGQVKLWLAGNEHQLKSTGPDA